MIKKRLANMEKVERLTTKKNYLTNQVRQIRLVLVKAERRENVNRYERIKRSKR